MFSSNTPPARRIRGLVGGLAGNRRKPPANVELPYISPGSNNAYGSKAANVPKPPRVADTRISLAAAMREKEDEMNARLRAEEEEREREAAIRQRQASTVPPSPTKSTPPSPTKSVTSEPNELSSLSGLVDRTYTSEFVVDPVVSNKVGNDNNDGDKTETENDNRAAGGRRTIDFSESFSTDFDADFDPIPPATRPLASKSPGPVRQPARIRGGGGMIPPINSLATGGAAAAGPSGGGAAGGPSGRPPKQTNAGGQENLGGKGGTRKNGVISGVGGGRPPPGNGAAAPAVVLRRRRVRKRDVDLDDATPNFRDHPLDWLMRLWFERFARWQIPVFLFAVIWFLVCLIAVQYFQALANGDGIFRGPDDNSIYFPPLEQPRDIRELADRVHKFEKNLGTVDAKLGLRIANEVTGLKSALARFASDSATASSTSSKETASMLASLRDQLDNLQKNTEQYKAQIAKELERTKEELRRTAHSTPGRLNSAQIREEVITGLREVLPASLAVSLDENGVIHTTEQFKTAIRELFDKFYPQKSDQVRERAGPDTIKSAPSWDSFIADNEKRLRHTIDSMLEENKGKAVLNKETVMMLVREQLDNYQLDWEKKVLHPLMDQRFDNFKTSFEKEQQKTLGTLKDTIDREQKQRLDTLETTIDKRTDRLQYDIMRKAEAAARRVAGSGGGQASSGSGPHSASGIQIPDYANILTGGRVWPYLTSPSYDFGGGSRGTMAKLYGLMGGDTQRHAPHPAVAILPTSDVGDCWAFPGHYGTIAIGLSQKIFPSHVTIEHISKLVAPDYTTAPKTIEFWVQVKDPVDREAVDNAAIQAVAISTGVTEGEASRAMQPGPMVAKDDKVAREFVKLETFEFDIDGETAQSFELSLDMTNLGVAVDKVAFVIKENYGNEKFTCLYRAKVHGFTPDAIRGTEAPPQESDSQSQKGWWKGSA